MILFEETNESELKEIHSHHEIATRKIDCISIDELIAEEELNSNREFMDDEELAYNLIEEYYE